jgi:hypothetical protein
MHESDIELDKKIEAALATYADPEASVNPSALAARILASAREEQQKARWWKWTLVIAAPALAALFVVLFLPEKPKEFPARLSASVPTPAQIMTAPATEKPVVSHTIAKARYSPHTTIAKSQEPPKLDIFPAPAPLSEQEKLLVAFVQNAQKEAREEAVRDSGPIQPITIAKLKIPLLDPSEKENPETGGDQE